MKTKILLPEQKIIYSRINYLGEISICEFNQEYEEILLRQYGKEGKILLEQVRYEHPFAVMFNRGISIPKKRNGDVVNTYPFIEYKRENNSIFLVSTRGRKFRIQFEGIDLDKVLADGYNSGINDRLTGEMLFPGI